MQPAALDPCGDPQNHTSDAAAGRFRPDGGLPPLLPEVPPGHACPETPPARPARGREVRLRLRPVRDDLRGQDRAAAAAAVVNEKEEITTKTQRTQRIRT